MILVENSPFGTSLESDFAAPHQNPFAAFDSPSPAFLDLEDIDQLLSGGPAENNSIARNQYCEYIDSDTDEDFLELDVSDLSSPDSPEDDLSSLNPSVQRLFCQTSMSNYSSASSVISSLVDDVGARLSESRNSIVSNKPNLNKSTYIFGTAFDNASSCGSGSSASSSTPSTPSSTIGAFTAFSTLQHQTVASSTLPSFNEIYSPRYKDCHSQFDCTGDIFKFEGYTSEESDSGSEDNNTALLVSTTATQHLTSGQHCAQSGPTGAGFDLLHPQIILKEEPMDSFVPTTVPLDTATMQLKQATTSKYIHEHHQQFGQQSMLSKVQGPFESAKVETEEHKEDLRMFRANSPRPMRYNLHSLPLNVMPGSACETVPYEDTYEAMESEAISRMTPGNVATFEQASLQGSSLMMPGSNGMQSMMAHAQSPMDSSMVESSAGPYRTKARSQRSKSMQSQFCAVCGDVAACQHYGVLTCEGCKGFFKRTVQKGSKYTCLGNKDCTVDKRRRNRCQFCRFQKCLAVGMVKEVVRTDNLKGRRGRLPSKPKSPQEAQQTLPMSTITALVRAHLDTSADKANLDFSQYNDSAADKAHIESRFKDFMDSQLLALLNSSLDTLYAFMEKIPGFNELNELDRKLLFQNSCLELFALRMAFRFKPGSNYIILCNNIVLHRNQFAVCFGEWLPMIEELSNQLHAMEIDISAFACLCALTVITGRHGVQDLAKIDQLETKIINSLKDHTVYNSEAQKKPNYFSRILSKLSELRSIGVLGQRVVMQRLAKFSTNATPEMRELEKKISPGLVLSNVAEMDTGLQADLAACFDLPSISSLFKGWPQVK